MGTLTHYKPPRRAGTALAWVFFTSVLSICSHASWGASFPRTYDADIQSAVHKYGPDLPSWRLEKAHLFQESRLDPTVCSQVGACGIGQFLGPTWQDVVHQLQWDISASPFNARLAIEGSAFYSAQLRSKWSAKGRSAVEHNDLGLCAYNRGMKNCLSDQTECNGAWLWPQIAPCTARHTMETVIYIQRINSYWKMMEAE